MWRCICAAVSLVGPACLWVSLANGGGKDFAGGAPSKTECCETSAPLRVFCRSDGRCCRCGRDDCDCCRKCRSSHKKRCKHELPQGVVVPSMPVVYGQAMLVAPHGLTTAAFSPQSAGLKIPSAATAKSPSESELEQLVNLLTILEKREKGWRARSSQSPQIDITERLRQLEGRLEELSSEIDDHTKILLDLLQRHPEVLEKHQSS